MGELDNLSLLSGSRNPKSYDRGADLFKRKQTRYIVTKGTAMARRSSAAMAASRVKLGHRSVKPAGKRGQVKAAVFRSFFTGAQFLVSSAVEGLRTLFDP